MSHVLRTDGEILRVEFSGELTNQDIARSVVEVSVLEDAHARVPDRIVDLTLVERLSIDVAGVLAVVDARRRKRFPNQFKTAVIAPNVVSYGFARMFQTLNDHPQILVAIFGDDAAARHWLRLADFAAPTEAWQSPLGQSSREV